MNGWIGGGAGDEPPHVEADFVESLGARSVYDAGCGTGRVATELARRGIAVAGVDIDPRMLRKARAAAPHLHWHLGDIARVNLRRRFDVVLLAGNVMIFLAPGSEGEVLRNLRRHLAPHGRLVAGFHLSTGYLDITTYDRLAAEAGLRLVARYGSWARAPWTATSNYTVSVHERDPEKRGGYDA